MDNSTKFTLSDIEEIQQHIIKTQKIDKQESYKLAVSIYHTTLFKIAFVAYPKDSTPSALEKIGMELERISTSHDSLASNIGDLSRPDFDIED